tara:strand:- start:209 stop:412 length:204 start_codon:yes stop_codon:yes gene_type:complete
MYNAIMKYNFKPERLKEALAIGTWASKDDADRFMKTGVFADIIKTFGDCMSDQPRGGDYKLEYFEEA